MQAIHLFLISSQLRPCHRLASDRNDFIMAAKTDKLYEPYTIQVERGISETRDQTTQRANRSTRASKTHAIRKLDVR